MSDGFDEYAATQLDGMKEGVANVTRDIVTDVGSSYQEVLLTHASISPPKGLTGTMESVTTETEITPPQPDMDMG